jgi:hypothetical protein
MVRSCRYRRMSLSRWPINRSVIRIFGSCCAGMRSRVLTETPRRAAVSFRRRTTSMNGLAAVSCTVLFLAAVSSVVVSEVKIFPSPRLASFVGGICRMNLDADGQVAMQAAAALPLKCRNPPERAIYTVGINWLRGLSSPSTLVSVEGVLPPTSQIIFSPYNLRGIPDGFQREIAYRGRDLNYSRVHRPTSWTRGHRDDRRSGSVPRSGSQSGA